MIPILADITIHISDDPLNAFLGIGLGFVSWGVCHFVLYILFPPKKP